MSNPSNLSQGLRLKGTSKSNTETPKLHGHPTLFLGVSKKKGRGFLQKGLVLVVRGKYRGPLFFGNAHNYLEVHGTYNLLNNCSYNPIISRVTVVMGLIFGL